MKRISLQTIAREAGVSKTTASLVLNGHAGRYHISPDTEQHVAAIAKRLDYKPNKLVMNPFNGKSFLLGIIFHGKTNQETGEWLYHLSREARNHDYFLMPEFTFDSGNSPDELARKFKNIGTDGLLVLNTEMQSPPLLSSMEFDTPLVFSGNSPANPSHFSVYEDYEAGTNQLIEQLYRRNKKAIGYLGYQTKTLSSEEKRKTYQENYCKRFDIEPNMQFVPAKLSNPATITGSYMKIIKKGANAILFEDRDLVLSALSNLEIRTSIEQNDILCACHGFHPGFILLNQPVICTKPKIQILARTCIEILMKLINNETEVAAVNTVSPELVATDEPKR